MPLTARSIAAVLFSALVFGLGLGAVTAPDRTQTLGEGQQPPAPSGTPSPVPPSASATATPQGDAGLTAAVDKPSAAPRESVTLRGRLSPAQRGVSLVVQRLTDGQWGDFPASTTTSSDGGYKVSLRSGRAGENVYRLAVRGSGIVSNEVRITTS